VKQELYARLGDRERRKVFSVALSQLSRWVGWRNDSRGSMETLRAHLATCGEGDRTQQVARFDDLREKCDRHLTDACARIAELEAERDVLVAERDARAELLLRLQHGQDAVGRFINELASALTIETNLRALKRKPSRMMRR